MAKQSAYGVHRLGAKISDQFPAVLGKSTAAVDEQQGEDSGHDQEQPRPADDEHSTDVVS